MASFAAEELPISKAVALALEYSPFMKAMTAGSQVAREKIGEAQAMNRAKIAVGVTDSTTDSPMLAFGSKLNQQRITAADFDPARLNDPDYTNNLQAGLQVVQPLYLGGMDRHAVSAARKGLQAQELDREQATQDVIFRTIEAYLNVILARESVSVAERAVEASKESLRNTSAAYEANQAVQSDVLQAQVHHSQNEETLLRMQNQYRLAREGLATVLGVTTVEEYRLNMPFLQQECQTCKEEAGELLKEALAERSDYRKLSHQMEAAGHMEKMARGTVRPHVAIGTRLEHNSRDLSRSGHANALFFARMDWNIGDGGEARHKARGAKWQAAQLADFMKAKEDQIRL
ncbi:MAG TPA: TolC family protein, partial [Candidatus Ozemobacteraceae bacterium]|nr:TolC family protein [Candidatus Ozemobacteraceae bacterium]